MKEKSKSMKPVLLAMGLGLILVAGVVLLRPSRKGEPSVALFSSSRQSRADFDVVATLPPSKPPPKADEVATAHQRLLAVALYQRRQMQDLYLDIVRRIHRKEPLSMALMEKERQWPSAQFAIDFSAFKNDRALYLISEEAILVDGQLEEIAERLLEILEFARTSPWDYPEAESVLAQRFEQLDRAIAGLAGEATPAAELFENAPAPDF